MSKVRNIANLPLDGGLLCLDFVNTVQTRKKNACHEYFTDYACFLEWCLKVDIVTQKEVKAFATNLFPLDKIFSQFLQLILDSK